MCAGLSSTEQQRFSVEDGVGSQTFELATMDSNTWVEVNYTQLVANAQRLLPLVKPGAIAMAMVKVRYCHIPIADILQLLSVQQQPLGLCGQ